MFDTLAFEFDDNLGNLVFLFFANKTELETFGELKKNVSCEKIFSDFDSKKFIFNVDKIAWFNLANRRRFYIEDLSISQKRDSIISIFK